MISNQTKNTKDSVQVCSILPVAHVGVRRVTLVFVHNGHQDKLVFLEVCATFFFFYFLTLNP